MPQSPQETATPEPIRVLIVDDHALFRRGLQMVLEGEADIDVVGEASDGSEAVKKAEDATPDVVLMDVRMPVLDGIEAARLIKSARPEIRVVLISAYEENEISTAALCAGADDLLLKGIAGNDLVRHVRGVAECGS